MRMAIDTTQKQQQQQTNCLQAQEDQHMLF